MLKLMTAMDGDPLVGGSRWSARQGVRRATDRVLLPARDAG
jgi:hypothetical protein